MHTKNRKKYLQLFVGLLIGLSFLLSQGTPVAASDDFSQFIYDTGCSNINEGSYTSITNPQKKVMDVYVRLGIANQTAKVSGFTIKEGLRAEGCKNLGTVVASGNSWTKLGRLAIAEQGEATVIELSSPSFEGMPNASRPTVLLLDPARPVCQPKDKCYLMYNGEPAHLRPATTLRDKSSLTVAQPLNPGLDNVKEVEYYAHNILVYKTKTLEPFDLRYSAGAGEDLRRIVRLASGQSIVIDSKAPLSHQDSFANFLFRIAQVYPIAFWLGIWLVILAAIRLTVGLILGMYRKQSNDREHHGFIKANSTALDKVENFLSLRQVKLASLWIKLLVLTPLCAYVIYDIIRANVVDFYAVNGRSMHSTLHDKDTMVVNKFTKLVADVNKREYVPKRGDILILNAIYGDVDDQSSKDNEHIIVKRLIGLPGERVTIKKGVITVFNKEYPEGFNPDTGSSWEPILSVDPYIDGVSIDIGTGELFVVGDNRPESTDSRQNGVLKTHQVIGKVEFHY